MMEWLEKTSGIRELIGITGSLRVSSDIIETANGLWKKMTSRGWGDPPGACIFYSLWFSYWRRNWTPNKRYSALADGRLVRSEHSCYPAQSKKAEFRFSITHCIFPLELRVPTLDTSPHLHRLLDLQLLQFYRKALAPPLLCSRKLSHKLAC